MKIRIPIPAWYKKFEDWANVPVWLWPWHVVRLDIILVVLWLLAVAWWSYSGGWVLVVQGSLLFFFIAIWVWGRGIYRE